MNIIGVVEYVSWNEDFINWGLCFWIVLGVVRGLSCLYYDCVFYIIYCDIECSNIFLDEYMEVYVGDFGFVKFVSFEKIYVIIMVVGIFWYLFLG